MRVSISIGIQAVLGGVLDANKLDLKKKVSVAGNVWRCALAAIGKTRRDIQVPLLPNLHSFHTVLPSEHAKSSRATAEGTKEMRIQQQRVVMREL